MLEVANGYKLNDSARLILDLILKGNSTKEIVQKSHLSRQSVYIYYNVLLREGFVKSTRVICPYEVTENGKNYLKSSDCV